MELEGILIMHAESGLPLFSKLKDNIDDVLFSGLLTAIKSFINELSLGGLSSFTTDENNFYLIGRESITTCLISKKNLDFKEVYSLAVEISTEFEKMFGLELEGQIDVNHYTKFQKTLDSILNKQANEIPFDIKVAEFVKKEFGENISYQPKLKNNEGKYITIDLLVDNGSKNSGFRNKFISRVHKSFSRDTTFVKVIDGIAGRAESLQFLDSIKTFGSRFSGPKDTETYAYFPRKSIIIARDYSPTLLEELDFKKHAGKSFIPATHILPTAGAHTAPDDMRCYVELWKWSEESYPERIFS